MTPSSRAPVVDRPPAAAFTDRVVDLPSGRSFRVRAPRLDDLDELMRLYDELDVEDRYRRFFSGYHPDRSMVESWIHAPEHGGCRIVVEEGERIIADSGYGVLTNGNAEFDITIVRGARGWLGAYLLDLLVEHAREAGIPNLEADILTENTKMLQLVQRRGYVVIGHDNYTTLRVAIGATTTTPTWAPAITKPRVVVESHTGRWHGEAAARSNGLAVVVCTGPQPGARPRCPAVEGNPCPLVQGADAVVVALTDAGDPLTRAVCDAHRSHHDDGKRVFVTDHSGTVSTAPVPQDFPALPADEAAVPALRRALGLDPTLPHRKR